MIKLKVPKVIKVHFLIFSLFLSIGLCIDGLLVFYYKDFLHNPQMGLWSTIFWLSSILVWGYYSFRIYKEKGDSSEKLSKKEIALFFLIILFSFLLRILWIGSYSSFLDDWWWLEQVRQILSGAILTPFGFIGDQPSNLPAFFVLPFYAFGKNYLAVRFTGVFFSIANIIMVFFLVKNFFNKKAAFFTIFLIATSIWDIHVSKIPWINTTINPLLISGSIYFFYKAINKLSFRNSFIAGIFMGLSINLLYLAAVNVFALIIFSLIKLITIKDKKNLLLRLLLIGFVTFLVSAPTFVKIIKYPGMSIARHEQFINNNLDNSVTAGGLTYYAEQIKITTDRFFAYYDDYRQHSFPYWGITIEPILQILFSIGLLYVLLRFKNDRIQILLLGFVVMFLPLVVLQRGVSEWREYGFFNYIYLFSGIGIWYTFSLIQKIFNRRTVYAASILFFVFAYLLLFKINYETYYMNNVLTNSYTYENQCGEIAEYILNNVGKEKTIYMPNEICKDLIATRIWDKYNYSIYYTIGDLEKIKQKSRKNIVIVSLGISYGSQSNVLGDYDVSSYLTKLNYKMKMLPQSRSVIYQQ